MATFMAGSNVAWHIGEDGVKRVESFGERLSTALCVVPPGYESSPECHAEEQGGYFVRGKMEWLVGEEGAEQTYLCEPGSMLIIAPQERHSNRVVGDEEAVVFVFLSPPRKPRGSA